MANSNDPVVKEFSRPLRERLPFWATIIAIGVAVASFSIGLVVNGRISSEDKHRTQQLQDVICGVYVPIGNSPIPATSTVLGRTIVAATRHGAIRIHCPGIK